MKIEIKNRFNDKIILYGEYESIKECLERNNGADLREADLIGANLSGASLNGADLSGASLNGADLSGANFYGADLSGADLSEADLSEASLYEANLNGADLNGANLSRADLSEANLSGASLNGADLSGASLNGANLSGASLYEAKNIQLPIINLTGSRHHFFYLNGEIQIGCEKHTVAHWIENYKTIGEANEYTEDQIKEYFGYINMVNNLIETGKV